MNDLDIWAAEKCGVKEYDDGNGHFFNAGHFHFYEWTLSDARCREIVREHFNIGTMKRKDKWLAVQNLWRQDDQGVNHCINTEGKSIEEAELACIAAIREGEG